MGSTLIFDFNKTSDIEKWTVVDDEVMGGKSSGTISLSPEGHGVFEGTVSLENNGGFSLVRYGFKQISTKKATKVVLKLKGDGKTYQFRIKTNAGDYYAYVSTFSTTGEWQEIEILLKDMYPAFRGRKLDQPNFSDDHIEEIGFLIGNKKQETFRLKIDRIGLE